ncbi:MULTISPECIES: two-component system QseEF-associated lipoprotein QseG [Enterobacteriaceae]|uniref:two-component system QseEF-associated lipoprotein QseG n=1 Tax=Enterobacteriaceae TaxID=543 RepID=UPI00124CDCC6|nr:MULTISPECIES: two-component system QseEF-associated lipoprotein QseG [Enterobacteriaceae]MDW2741871.1 two-component system QseEF-associated lipoprotein QseG [Atlantibacter subterranea]QFH72533.1 two-component system QseEF-associated lipoprotein QseG [Enterobacter sp. E76]UTJ48519.1 two-component system QseEF-associated lipoprotein QseG [Atlantibacter subterranea]
MNLFFSRLWRRAASSLNPVLLRPVAGSALAVLLLSGCVPDAIHSKIDKHQHNYPERQVADFLSTDCQEIWSLSGRDSDSNPLYWLRGIDCAERLAPADARAEARALQDDTWQATFKRGILLSSAKISPGERRRYVTRLDELSADIPAQIRPLYQVWRDNQAAQLQLAEERSRYAKLQQTSDSELDTLREQQQHLHSQLALVTRKLENLTDIERRLSSRKTSGGELPDATHPAAAPDDKDTPADTQEAKP